MANEGERSASADKGKGKVDDVKDLPGAKKAQNEDAVQTNGKKKEEESQEGRSSSAHGARESALSRGAPLDFGRSADVSGSC